MNPVNWFEIPVKNINESKAFYEAAFGFEMLIHKMGDILMAWFPSANNESGASGSLIEGESYEPSHLGSMVYFSVDDIEAVLTKVVENKGKILNAKMDIGEYGFFAHFEDIAGNRIGLHSMK